jgi:hypothetical protein
MSMVASYAVIWIRKYYYGLILLTRGPSYAKASEGEARFQYKIHQQIKSMWYVYILKCNDGTYYTGCTENLVQRMNHHNNGMVNSTKYKKPTYM